MLLLSICIYSNLANEPTSANWSTIISFACLTINLSAGWPWWDALKGQVKDTVEVLTSTDAKQYTSR